MPTVSNKTQKPLSVPLPGGKILHLGPGKTGQISPKAVDSPHLKRLADAGDVVIVNEDVRTTPGGGQRRRNSTYGHTSSGVSRRGGDR